MTRLPVSDGHYRTYYAGLFEHSAPMRDIRRWIEQVARTDATVLVRGESGVGKEIVAKAIHAASPRGSRPFVKVNCAALPAELLESELFGHEKGAFTGAYRRKPGKFEIAHEGTIFLDEIGDLPVHVQAKLLHVLQDHTFARVGGAEILAVDCRVIASTNRPLEAAVRAGQFREDLYYRLKVITLHVPPLRERCEEIPGLAHAFVERFNRQYQQQMALTPRSLDLLRAYGWPGNVRELENMIKRFVVLGDTKLLDDELMAAMEQEPPGGPVTPAASPSARSVAAPGPTTPPPKDRPAGSLQEIARRAAIEAQRDAIRDVLEQVRWNRAEAARLLNISYKALLYKIDQCGLARKRRGPESRSGGTPGALSA